MVIIVQDLYSSFLKRDFEAILAMLSTEVEWGQPDNPYNPAGGTRHGQEGFWEWLQVGNAAEEILALETRKFLSDNDSVAVVGFTQCLARSTK